MKKTIAILLVLVIGMAGMFAADALATVAEDAKITITTDVVEKALFGLTVTPLGIETTAFTNVSTFESEASILDQISYTNNDMSVFAVDSGNGQIVGYLQGISNRAAGVVLAVAVTDFTDGEETDPYTIPLTATVGNLTIPPVSAANGLGTLQDAAIAIKITDNDVYYAAPAANYTSTVTISVSSV